MGRNNQYLLSTGCQQMDEIVNGYTVGSIVLIVNTEDYPAEFGLQMIRLAAAEAVVNEQKAVVFDGFMKRGREFWTKLLPKVAKAKRKEGSEERKGEMKGEGLVCAWRYNECLETQASLKEKQQLGAHKLGDFRNRLFEYQFDISHEMESTISGLDVTFDKDKYFDVITDEIVSLNDLWSLISTQYQEKLESADDKTFFRFFIPDILNFDLLDDSKDFDSKITSKNIIKFLRNLRTLVKTMNCVFTMTIDKNVLKSQAILNYFIKMSDLVFEIKSFSDSEYKFLDYQGTIQILKQPAINGLIGHKSSHDIYVFKSDRRKFLIETVHLQPEEESSTNNSENLNTKESQSKPALLCSSKPSTKDPLDF